MSLHTVDPVAIRRTLEAQRILGADWPEAWSHAIEDVVLDRSVETHVLTFMERHFRAAYFNDHTPHGRCTMPDRDVSAAVGVLFSLDPELVPAPMEPSRDREYCRSGDGCDRLAVRGRHGRMWCDYHASDLERLRVVCAMDLAKADPRKGGNDSLYTHRAA